MKQNNTLDSDEILFFSNVSFFTKLTNLVESDVVFRIFFHKYDDMGFSGDGEFDTSTSVAEEEQVRGVLRSFGEQRWWMKSQARWGMNFIGTWDLESVKEENGF